MGKCCITCPFQEWWLFIDCLPCSSTTKCCIKLLSFFGMVIVIFSPFLAVQSQPAGTLGRHWSVDTVQRNQDCLLWRQSHLPWPAVQEEAQTDSPLSDSNWCHPSAQDYVVTSRIPMVYTVINYINSSKSHVAIYLTCQGALVAYTCQECTPPSRS